MSRFASERKTSSNREWQKDRVVEDAVGFPAVRGDMDLVLGVRPEFKARLRRPEFRAGC